MVYKNAVFKIPGQ